MVDKQELPQTTFSAIPCSHSERLTNRPLPKAQPSASDRPVQGRLEGAWEASKDLSIRSRSLPGSDMLIGEYSLNGKHSKDHRPGHRVVSRGGFSSR